MKLSTTFLEADQQQDLEAINGSKAPHLANISTTIFTDTSKRPKQRQLRPIYPDETSTRLSNKTFNSPSKM